MFHYAIYSIYVCILSICLTDLNADQCQGYITGLYNILCSKAGESGILYLYVYMKYAVWPCLIENCVLSMSLTIYITYVCM